MRNNLLLAANCLGILLVLGFYFSFRKVVTSFLNALLSAEIHTGTPSVGIIGGADGPTAVFVSTPHPPQFQWILFLPLIVVIGIFILNSIYLYRNNKSKNENQKSFV
jgi:Na+-transporting methylmalonyl-CoA/oxaloacetate decarboxylase beta subunit